MAGPLRGGEGGRAIKEKITFFKNFLLFCCNLKIKHILLKGRHIKKIFLSGRNTKRVETLTPPRPLGKKTLFFYK